tara:strand:+ start:763 stop:1206 length:444 start_codon:yes stop_codon:yes gene_type:complete
MNPYFILASAAIQGMGYMSASAGVKAEARLTQRNLESQAKYRKLQGLQEHNQIMDNLEAFKDTNSSLVGVMGRDEGSDRSLKKLREKATKDNATAIARANVQLGADISKMSQQAQLAQLKSKNLQRAYRYKMFSSFANAGYQYSLVS